MLWIGWIVALIVALIALGLQRKLRTERAHGVQLLYAKIDAENTRDSLQGELAQLVESWKRDVRERTERLDGLTRDLRARLEESTRVLGDYRASVRRFDGAVQYCLQPVELIFGADKASLDELVSHVEGARRELFEARRAMEQHPMHRAADPFDGLNAEVRALLVFVHGPQQDELPLSKAS